jgi:hypothetical protein
VINESGAREGENPVSALGYSYRRAPRGPLGLTSDGRIVINRTYTSITYGLLRDLEFRPVIFGAETSD